MAEIGIIGGTGVYDPEFLKDSRDIKMSTPSESLLILLLSELLGERKSHLFRAMPKVTGFLRTT